MLTPFSSGMQPLGHHDVLNTQAASLKGGEVMTFAAASRTNSSTETAAADALDGYDYAIPLASATRVVAQLATAAVEPVMLADEGTSGYSTMLGTVVGGNTGLVVSGGAALGPHTTAGSGKVTLWDKPGQYVITTDALAATFLTTLASTGLEPNTVLGHTSAGLLQHSTANGAVAGTGVATFVEFMGSGSFVTTPPSLVGAAPVFDRILIHFHAGHGTRTVATNP